MFYGIHLSMVANTNKDYYISVLTKTLYGANYCFTHLKGIIFVITLG